MKRSEYAAHRAMLRDARGRFISVYGIGAYGIGAYCTYNASKVTK